MSWNKPLGVRHLDTVAVKTELTGIMTGVAAAYARAFGHTTVTPREVRGMRKFDTVAPDTVVLMMACGTRAKITHPVRLLPVRTVGDLPRPRREALVRPATLMTSIALERSGF